MLKNPKGLPNNASIRPSQRLHAASLCTTDMSGNIKSLIHKAQTVGLFAWQPGSVAETSFVLRLVKGKDDKGCSGPGYDIILRQENGA